MENETVNTRESLFSVAELRTKAERHIVYPLNRDECLWLVEQAEIAAEARLVRDVSRRGFGYGWRRFDALVRKVAR